jgi:hypothetical protein
MALRRSVSNRQGRYADRADAITKLGQLAGRDNRQRMGTNLAVVGTARKGVIANS